MRENNGVLTIIDADDLQEDVLSIEVTESKPFNKCLHCAYLGNGCSGPNLNVMSVERACEFLQMRRIQLGYSYQKVADLSYVSVTTIKRILTGKIKDPSFMSMQALSFALVADQKGKYPCAMHLFSEEKEQAVAACKIAQGELVQKEKDLAAEKKKTEYLMKQVEFKESQMLAKDKLINDRYQFLKLKDRHILALSILLVLAVAVIITALIVDRLNPDVGFFWTMFHRATKAPLFDFGI